MKENKEGCGLPAAALSGVARTAAGAGWLGVLAIGAGAAVLRKLPVKTTAPRWLLAVQALFGAFVLHQALIWAGESWQGMGSGTWIGLILLGLAFWLARKGRQAVQAASGVLGIAEAVLLAAVLLGSIRDVRPADFLQDWRKMPDGWLLTALLIPGEGQGNGWIWALPFCIVTAGTDWHGSNAFLEMSRSVSGVGPVRRLESLTVVGLTLGFFLMMVQLLSREHPGDRPWSAALATGLFLSGFHINSWLVAGCSVLVWYFLPALCGRRENKRQNE